MEDYQKDLLLIAEAQHQLLERMRELQGKMGRSEKSRRFAVAVTNQEQSALWTKHAAD